MTPRERAEDFCADTGADEVVRIDDLEQLIKDAVEDALDTSCAAGKEAEELRDRIGALVDEPDDSDSDLETRIRNVLDGGSDLPAQIREIFNDVDARDANQWLVHKARVEKLEEIVGALAHSLDVLATETSDGTHIVTAARALMGHRGPSATIPASSAPGEVRVTPSPPSPRSRTE